ncbi:MAG TPA: hypothetical protein VFM93_03660 [Candidatus Limnocylindria bacterium]|nr:hypothetical protein [Candidatus Limnocylindria bacterium]
MDLLTLIIVILLVLWLFGYFGRGRWYGRGPNITAPAIGSDWLSWLIVIVLVIVVLRALRVI